MSQLQPIVEPEIAPLERPLGAAEARPLHLPGLGRAAAREPQVALRPHPDRLHVLVAVIAPWISVNNPTDFNILATRQAPSWNHLFGTTDQGSDIFSQVVLGARRSLMLGAAAAVLATVLARRSASSPPTAAASSTRSSTS